MLIVFVVFIFGLFSNFILQGKMSKKINITDKKTTFYKVLDCYDLPEHETFSNTIKKKGVQKQFETLYYELNNAKKIRYYEVYESLLQYQGYYDKDKSFLNEYGFVSNEELDGFINQEIKIDGKEMLLTNIKGIFISERAFNEDLLLKEHIKKGSSFSSSDFLYNNKEINVVLGCKYAEWYNIGERINVLYLGYPLKLNIVGFLDETAFIKIENDCISLDSYIVLPSFIIENKSAIDNDFIVMHWSNKTKGFLSINNDKELDEFEEIVKEIGLDYTCIPMSEEEK